MPDFSVLIAIVLSLGIPLGLSLIILLRTIKNEQSLRQLVGEYQSRTQGLKNVLVHAQTRIEQSDVTLSYERAYDPLPLPVLLIDAEGRCQFMNTSAAALIGKPTIPTFKADMRVFYYNSLSVISG